MRRAGLALLVAVHAAAAAAATAGEPTAALVPLDDATLAALTGGLRTGGVDVSVAVDSRTRFDAGAGAGDAPLSAAAAIARAGAATLIVNAGDGRAIDHAVRVDIVVTRLAATLRQAAVLRAGPRAGVAPPPR